MKFSSFFVALFITLYSGAAHASPSQGPSWEVLAFGLVGLVISCVGFWVKSVSKSQDDNAKQIIELQKALLSGYHPKSDIAEMMREVRAALGELRDENRRHQEKMEKKFDHLESIYGR